MSETIKIPTKQLRDAIQISTLTTSKEKENILSNTLIKIKDDIINISSRNPITKSNQTIKIDKTGQIDTFLINPNMMFNILKELKEEITDIETEENIITLKNGRFKTTIKTLNKDLYPDEAPIEKEPIGKIDFNKLKHLMKSTIPYPDRNDISREYTGVLIEIQKNLIKATATDHFRLINVIANIENNEIEEKFIIENDGGNLISKIDMEDSVELSKNKQSIELKDSEISIESKIIQGEFPNYESILLSEDDNRIVVDKEEFLSSIKRVSITNANSEIEISLKPETKILNISSENQEGEKSEDEIEIRESSSNNEFKIKLNSKFLSGFLSQMNTKEIDILYRSQDEPIMLKCKDDIYTYNYIVTPITS